MITRAFRRAVELVVRAMAEWQGWQAWTPTYGASGSMTFTSVTTALAVYKQIGKTVYFCISATGTTGGTASNFLTFTFPVTMKDTTQSVSGGGSGVDTVSGIALTWFNYSTTVARVARYDAGNWALAAGRNLTVEGFYEAA